MWSYIGINSFIHGLIFMIGKSNIASISLLYYQIIQSYLMKNITFEVDHIDEINKFLRFIVSSFEYYRYITQ